LRASSSEAGLAGTLEGPGDAGEAVDAVVPRRRRRASATGVDAGSPAGGLNDREMRLVFVAYLLIIFGGIGVALVIGSLGA
jgi:hypothetical protein